ncbi:MAG: hypothetical protein IJW29_05075 [Clostridia bacterium]|nr:hypothetical protein [Clostridia bacterium]
MEEKSRGVEIRFGDLWQILKRCWWLMLAVLLVVFLSVFIFEKATYEEEYTATGTVWALGSNASSAGSTSTSDVSIATALINDYKVLLLTDEILQKVIDAEGLLLKPAQLRSMISIENEDDTRVMKISVTASTPSGAKAIVDRLVDVFVEEINKKNDNVDGKELVKEWGDEAPLPERPSNSVSVLKIGLIAFVCAIAVYAVYFVLYLMDDKISTAEDVERYLGVSTLGLIPNRQDVMRRRRSKGGYYGYGGGTQASNRGGKV